MFSPASILQTPNVNLQVIFMSLLLSFKAKVRPFFSSRNVLNVSPFCLALPKQPHLVPRASRLPSIFWHLCCTIDVIFHLLQIWSTLPGHEE